MKQADLNRAVAHATGETVATIKRLGFLIAEPDEVLNPDSEDLGPYIIDWDELADRAEPCTETPQHEPAVA